MGFQHMHQQNIIHRDMKSPNIFISNGVLKIGDLGFSKQVLDNFTNTLLGTPLCMAPEILDGKKYDNRYLLLLYR
jgi:serine/threonine protein kinase